MCCVLHCYNVLLKQTCQTFTGWLTWHVFIKFHLRLKPEFSLSPVDNQGQKTKEILGQTSLSTSLTWSNIIYLQYYFFVWPQVWHTIKVSCKFAVRLTLEIHTITKLLCNCNCIFLINQYVLHCIVLYPHPWPMGKFWCQCLEKLPWKTHDCL